MKKLISIFVFALLIGALAVTNSNFSRIKAAGLTSMSMTGGDFTSTTVAGTPASAIPISTLIDDAGGATLSFNTASNLTTASFLIRIQGFVHSGTPNSTNDLAFGSGTTTGCTGAIVNGSNTGQSGGVITYQFSISGYTTGCNLGSTIELDIDPNILTSSAIPGNYPIAITVDADYGAFYVYVGNANQIIVSASVSGSISFKIVAPNFDSATTSSCPLGVLSTTAVSSCSYRIFVGSNAQNGFNVYTQADGALSTSPGGGGNVIPNTTDGVITAGVEEYGANIAIGTVLTDSGTTSSTAAYNVHSAFATNNYNGLPTSPTLIVTAAGTNSPANNNHTILVTHQASISASTLTGNYSQKLDYFVNGSF